MHNLAGRIIGTSPPGEMRSKMAILRDLLSDWSGRLILAFLVATIVVNIIVIWP
jgi:hypothetical protein